MKTDRELLELAAKAAGIHGTYQHWEDGSGNVSCGIAPAGSPGRMWWNPLTDDGDALRLAVKLKMLVDITSFSTTAIANGDVHANEKHNGDPYVATRRAIVRAAAAIGEGMK